MESEKRKIDREGKNNRERERGRVREREREKERDWERERDGGGEREREREWERVAKREITNDCIKWLEIASKQKHSEFICDYDYECITTAVWSSTWSLQRTVHSYSVVKLYLLFLIIWYEFLIYINTSHDSYPKILNLWRVRKGEWYIYAITYFLISFASSSFSFTFTSD